MVENNWLGRLLKLSTFVVQKAATPKNGVEFCQKSIGVLRCSLAALYNDMQHQLKFSRKDKQTNEATYRGGAHLEMQYFDLEFNCSLV